VRTAIVLSSTSRSRGILALFVAGMLLASSLGCAGGLADLAAHFGPALLLLSVLAFGLYPGEVAVARLRRRVSARHARPTWHRAPRRAPQRVVAFRARLLAYHLAVRPPPAGGSAVA
jgi:hypothetical protein